MKLSISVSLVLQSYLLAACLGGKSAPQVESMARPDQSTILKSVIPSDNTLQLDKLIVFGDSLSDTGRLQRRTMGLYAPSDVYWHGRLTNGPNWSDYVCGALSCRNQNYAVAGAATRLSKIPLRWIVRPLDAQVEEFLHDDDRASADKSIAVIWIGPNNYLKQSDMRTDAVREDIKTSAIELFRGSTQKLLIGSMPQLAGILQSPEDPDPVSAEAYRRVTMIHNNNIRAIVAELQGEFPGKSIALYDAYEINNDTIERPREFGFTSLTEACYHGNYRGQFHGERKFCSDYFGFKFWDYTHPNSRMHCFYAARFLLSMHEAGWLVSIDAEKALNLCKSL